VNDKLEGTWKGAAVVFSRYYTVIHLEELEKP
jgi:hypothetical protein